RLLSPPGLAGIAILSATAEEQPAILATLETANGQPCQLLPGQPPMRAVLRLDGRVVDDVLAVVRARGELELHVHGSAAVLDQLDQHFGVATAVPSSPAERLLREAFSERQLALAIEQMQCSFDAGLQTLRALPPADRRQAAAAARERSR